MPCGPVGLELGFQSRALQPKVRAVEMAERALGTLVIP